MRAFYIIWYKWCTIFEVDKVKQHRCSIERDSLWFMKACYNFDLNGKGDGDDDGAVPTATASCVVELVFLTLSACMCCVVYMQNLFWKSKGVTFVLI